ncbi:hypothetical protein BGZ65_005460 [Modicella reniformis]|uniref:Uncharacterized protein n=1 Tax=Modicella reniformis TaxID=1440133 RepID=A0A9P6LXP7_9FUNG|nr:hypothetical protein BGZ65_005460 [Modicella reniformis]
MVVETYTIHPTNKYNRPPPPSTIALHGLDLLSAPIQIRNHRFFHRPTSTTFDVIDKLKSTLAEALELYPPVAGTVQVNEKAEMYIAMDDENILGTPFLVEMKDTPYAGDTEDLSPRTAVVLPPSSSTLAVKVTQPSPLPYTIKSQIYAAFSIFLNSGLNLPEVRPSILQEFQMIESTVPKPPPPPFMVLPAPATGPPSFLLAPSEISTWKFTKNSMERLRSDFWPSASSKEHKSDLWISSGDALAALLCGVITRARENANVARLQERSSSESQTENIMMAADGRERAPQGNMSGQYFGNFNTILSATVSRSDLLSLTCESASRVALAIRTALKLQLSPEAIADKISFFEDPQNTKPPGRIAWSADLILTNWCRFDLQGPKLDFGWGKPFCTTAGSGGAFPPGYCMMMQEKDSGDIFVLMTVEREGADRLKADSLLNNYATLVPVHNK